MSFSYLAAYARSMQKVSGRLILLAGEISTTEHSVGRRWSEDIHRTIAVMMCLLGVG